MVRRRKTVRKSHTTKIFILMFIGSLIAIISVYTASTYMTMFGFTLIILGALIASTEGDA